MQGLNRIFLLGYLGSEPQIYSAKNGRPYTGLSIATHRPQPQPQESEEENETKETTDWHYVRVWGKQGETCAKYLAKGQAVMVEGYLTQYTRQREDGESEKKTGINALKVDFLPRARTQSEVT